MAKKTREKFKTYKNVFDAFTERNLFKLQSQGYFEEGLSPIFIGKESNVFSCVDKKGKKIIVKIYRLETCDFNRMFDYIKFDPRYIKLKKQKRQIIFSWTQREYRNLLKARDGGVRVPTPLTFNHNILVEDMIGDPSPRLKDSHPEDADDFFKQVIKNMRLLYKAGLVHADLSPFNILNYNEKPVFIDFSQATPLENVRADEFLERDIRNICNFFNKLSVKTDKEKIKKHIKQ